MSANPHARNHQQRQLGISVFCEMQNGNPPTQITRSYPTLPPPPLQLDTFVRCLSPHPTDRCANRSVGILQNAKRWSERQIVPDYLMPLPTQSDTLPVSQDCIGQSSTVAATTTGCWNFVKCETATPTAVVAAEIENISRCHRNCICRHRANTRCCRPVVHHRLLQFCHPKELNWTSICLFSPQNLMLRDDGGHHFVWLTFDWNLTAKEPFKKIIALSAYAVR